MQSPIRKHPFSQQVYYNIIILFYCYKNIKLIWINYVLQGDSPSMLPPIFPLTMNIHANYDFWNF